VSDPAPDRPLRSIPVVAPLAVFVVVVRWLHVASGYSGFAPDMALMGLWATLLLLAAGVLVLGRSPWRWLILPALALGGGLGQYEVERQPRTAGERADRILAAVSAYRSARGSCPVALDDLVPDFLRVVPTSGAGPWNDRAFVWAPAPGEPGCGALGFEAAASQHCVRRTGLWDCASR